MALAHMGDGTMANEQLKMVERGALGALGGICLVILKLIDNGFFLEDLASIQALAAYLTYGCYVVLGTITAMFFAEIQLPRNKARKNALITGLLAPSILLALTIKPVPDTGPPEGDLSGITRLSEMLIPKAHAQAPSNPAQPNIQPQMLQVQQRELEPSFGEALRIAIGRPQRPQEERSYVYIIAVSSEQEMALKASSDVNSFLFGAKETQAERSNVLILEGNKDYFVTVGDFQSKEEAIATREAVRERALEELKQPAESEDTRKIVDLLLDGRVVERQAFVAQR